MGDFTTEWERPEFDSVPSLAEDMMYLLPGCDAVLVRKSLQWAYRDFCRRSATMRTWRRIETLPRVRMYPVAPVLSSEIECVTQVRDAATKSPLLGWRCVGDPPMLELLHSTYRHCIVEGPDVAWVQEKPNVGSLPVEDEANDRPPCRRPWGLMVEAVEIPHIGEERAPRAFLRRYGDALVDGALARLFSMSGRAWTDAEQFRQRAVAYNNAVSAAKISAAQGGPAANPGATFALDMSTMV